MGERFRIFLSGVSSEFRAARAGVRTALRTRGLEVKEQTEFRQEADTATTLDKLYAYIAGCDAVVALVGRRSGDFPPPAAVRAAARIARWRPCR